jgi:hypothetical protein
MRQGFSSVRVHVSRTWAIHAGVLRIGTLLIIGALLLGAPRPAQAGLMISLSSDAADPGHLHIGQDVHVQVELSGLNSGDELVALSARTTFDASLLGTPLISASSIVPNPLNNPLDFTSLADPGAADVTFFTLGTATSDHITNDGAFYEFSVVAQAMGTTNVLLAFTDAQQVDPSDPGNLLSPSIELGAPLSFTVVPEPNAVGLGLCGIAIVFMARLYSGFKQSIRASIAR